MTNLIIPDTKDFRTKELLKAIYERKQYQKIYEGNIGNFFDSLNANPYQIQTAFKQSYDEILKGNTSMYPRAQSFLTEHDSDWKTSIPHFANYLRVICEIYSDFVLGDGMKVVFEKDEHSDLWEAFSKQNDLESLAVDVLHQVIYAGYSGTRIYVEDEIPKIEQLDFYNYFPDRHITRGYQHKNITILYVVKVDDKEYEKINNRKLAYVIRYENGIGTHSVYYYQDYGSIENKLAEGFEDLFWDNTSNITSDGTEEMLSDNVPVQIVNSPLRGELKGLGKSFSQDIISQIQDLGVLTTIASNEIHRHFKAKMAVPESAVQAKEDGTAELQHPDYFVMDLDSQMPQYIQKDIQFFQPLFDQRANLLNEISLDTKIPVDLLIKKTTGNEDKVGVTKLLTKPFIQRNKQLRNRMHTWLSAVIVEYFEAIGIDKVEFEIEFDDTLGKDEEEKRKELNDMFDRGIISRETYLRILKGYDAEIAKQEIAKRLEEDEKFNKSEEPFPSFEAK